MDYDYEIAIIGAGAAGYSAAIYAGRSGATVAVFDRGMGGGLTMEAPKVENYPGFKSIGGVELMEKMKEHASEYAEMKFGEEVTSIKITGEGVEMETTRGKYNVGAVIICTGTEHRKLNVKGEKEFSGRGVSYCATCDGFFFKGLRAEKALEEEAREKGIEFIWNSVVEEIFGDSMVKGIKIKNVKTGEESNIEVDGVFISIGEEPQNRLAKEIGVELDENGYIKTDEMGRTNMERIFAAGDITGGVRQIVTACAEGAKAALSAMRAIGKRSPY